MSEKSGRIFTATGLSDGSLSLVADLSDDVYNYWDRGLLGLAVDPSFPSRPYLYALYAYDHILGDAGGDAAMGRDRALRRLPEAAGRQHRRLRRLRTVSIAYLRLHDARSTRTSSPTGVSSSPVTRSAHSRSGPKGRCTSRGATARASTRRTTASSPSTTAESIRAATRLTRAVRCARRTCGPVATRPASTAPSCGSTPTRATHGPTTPTRQQRRERAADHRRRTAQPVPDHGPLRTAPSGSGDVGYDDWEEIDRIPDPDAAPRNFGWPCYEGNAVQAEYAGARPADLRGSRRSDGPAVHVQPRRVEVVGGDGCRRRQLGHPGSPSAGRTAPIPTSYDTACSSPTTGARCIWFVPSTGGEPDFAAHSSSSPTSGSRPRQERRSLPRDHAGGDLIYTDLNRNEVRTITYDDAPRSRSSPTHRIAGIAPLTVTFNASGSPIPTATTLTYAWDLDGDGPYDDSTSRTPSEAVHREGVRAASASRSPTRTATATRSTTRSPRGRRRPSPTSIRRRARSTWAVGDEISFSGHATDAAGRRRCPISRSTGRSRSSTVHRTATSTPSRPGTASHRASSTRPTTTTHRTCGSCSR